MKVVHRKEKPKNILFFGDFDTTTGFGNVSRHLIDNWSKDKKIRITVFAINNFAKAPYDYADNVKVIPALSLSETKKDVYCRLEFLKFLYQNDFDVIFCLSDIEVFSQLKEHLKNVKNEKRKQNRPNFKSIVYFPIDSEPRPIDVEPISFFDEAITYTEYAKAVMKPLLSDTQFKKVKVIPHGCNTEDYYPFSDADKLKAKKEIFGTEDVFVFGSVNRNSARKDIATLVIGYAMFKHKNQANSILYLHCNPLDTSGIDINRLCQRVGLEVGKDVIFPKDFSENNGFAISELNKIYNAMDCFITTTTAEGWGLTITEAMATKTLVICPKHTSLTEITDNGENTLNFMFSQQAVFVNDFEKIRFISNPTEVSTLCEVAYNLKNESDELKEIVKTKIENAYKKVTAWKWEDISKRFKVIIDKLAK
jgi:glycosyltransferase involved in cell wall biosynthesis